MLTLVADCPRCAAKKHTFDIPAHVRRSDTGDFGWQQRAEVFSICRGCRRSSIFIVEVSSFERTAVYDSSHYWNSDENLNDVFRLVGHVNLRDNSPRKPPEHLPTELADIFSEGTTCLAMQCHNAAGTMFRLCLDMATRELLPAELSDDSPAANGPNKRQRRDLGLRLPWLIEKDLLPGDLADLAHVVREDGNDGAHAGTLSKDDAEDLADFTEILLTRLYTDPARVELAKARRIERRDRD